MALIDTFLGLVCRHNASDLHISAGSPPFIRVQGDLVPLDFRRLSPGEATDFLYEILTDKQIKRFEEELELDFAYHLAGQGRFRVNYYHQRLGVAGSFRLIPKHIRTIEQLNLPRALADFASIDKGLLLVTGPTGSGKSATLAAIVDAINQTSRRHIVTIEDPIEYVHTNKSSVISQREVGSHANSFASALRAALRESPDVILVGELRDLETIELAMTGAEMGILIMATLHTNNVAQTVDRIIDVFPAKKQEQIRSMLSVTLAGVVSQHLLKSTDGFNRIPVVELLIGSPALANLIRESKSHLIHSYMQSSEAARGNQTLDQALKELLDARRIHPQDAYQLAVDKAYFRQFMPIKDGD